jgi:hypothetical protein
MAAKKTLFATCERLSLKTPLDVCYAAKWPKAAFDRGLPTSPPHPSSAPSLNQPVTNHSLPAKQQ